MPVPKEMKGLTESTLVSVPLPELVLCVSSAVDLMCREVAEHHKRVAFIATAIGEVMGLEKHRIHDMLVAGLLHDVGAFSLQERLDTLSFETRAVGHAASGAALLRTFAPFERVAEMVRHHHADWEKGEAVKRHVPYESLILHLADRVAVQMHDAETVLERTRSIKERIHEHSGTMFPPELVDAFMDIGERESFWLDVVSQDIGVVLGAKGEHMTMQLDPKGLLEFGKLVTRLIDFRSRFTSVHSRGVAACAEALADLSGFSEEDRVLMRMAGYLHDLGKLVVPSEIIEKNSSLSMAERSNVMRHTFYTYRILEHIKAFEKVRTWAAFHHERMDGSGYPFHLKGEQLPHGSRIMAVADVFTALTEDRPYRSGMSLFEAQGIMREMVAGQHLDGDIVALAGRHSDSLNATRELVQVEALEDYASFMTQVQGGQA